MKSRILLLFISLLLTACASTPKEPLSPADQQAILLKKLNEGGVRSWVVGDEWRLILPNSRFFVAGTARLKISSYPTLDRIITLLNQQKHLGIDLLTCTQTLNLNQKTSDFAKQRVLTIEEYLLDHGLSARIIIARAWNRENQRHKGAISFNEDPPQVLSTEIRTRQLPPEESE